MVSTAAGDKSWRKVWQSWHKFHLIEKVWRRTFQVYDESGYFCWQEQDYQNMEKCSLDKSFILLLIVKGTTYLRCKCLLFKTDASLVGKLILASCCQVIINFNISNNTNNFWGNCVDQTALYNKVKIEILDILVQNDLKANDFWALSLIKSIKWELGFSFINAGKNERRGK